ncbi:hypothetical protein [Kaarinaea lacus]
MDALNLDLPNWVLWIAQDENGAWWGYECEPLQHDTGWYENEVGRRIKLQMTKSDLVPNPQWRSSLKKISK